MAKVNIADLLTQKIEVQVAEGKFLELRPLNLKEMITLLLTNKELFIGLYSQFQAEGSVEQKVGGLLLAAPEFIAQIIAMGADAVGQEEMIMRLPPTVQLIAVHDLWKASVPDPKKRKSCYPC